MAPFPWNGSDFIYHRILKPFVAEHKEKIDEYLEKAKERASHLYDEGRNGHSCHSHLFCLVFVLPPVSAMESTYCIILMFVQ